MDVGEKLGKYEIRGTLGRGAMGVVYDAWDPLIQRRVAIKTIRLPREDEDPEAAEGLARFRREAQAAGRLQHPNIVGVFDYGETGEFAYLVMEFVDGRSVKQALDAQERFPIPQIARLMRELLEALQYSHEHGVVHRDIKPANMMLTLQGRVKVADFGVARIESSSMTQVGTVIGTPAYMSPEQLAGQTVDSRTDLYSAGVVLYQLLTGDRPYHGSNLTSIYHQALNSEPVPPSKLAVTVPPAFDPVVARAMAKRPGERYGSALEFAAAIDRAANDGAEEFSAGAPDSTVVTRSVQATPERQTPPPAGRPDARQASSGPASAAAPSARPRSRTPALAAAAAAVLLVVGGGTWAVTNWIGGGGTKPNSGTGTSNGAGDTDPKAGTGTTNIGGGANPNAGTGTTRVAGSTNPNTGTGTTNLAGGTNPNAGTGTTNLAGSTNPSVGTGTTNIGGGANPNAGTGTTRVAGSTNPNTGTGTTNLAGGTNPNAGTGTTNLAGATNPNAGTGTTNLAGGTNPNAGTGTTNLAGGTNPNAGTGTTNLAGATNAVMPGQLRSAIAAALAPVDCSLVGGNVSGDRVSLVGLAGRGTPLKALDQAIHDAAPSAAVDWRVASFDGPYCRALDVIRPVATGFGTTGSGFSMELRGGNRTLVDGQLMTIDFTMPNFPGWLTVDYLQHDGTVWHMHPTLKDPPRQYAQGAHVSLGDAAAGGERWEVGKPYGTDMIIAVAASEPLFTQRRKELEPADAYLAALRAAIETAQRRNERLAADAVVLTTEPKH